MLFKKMILNTKVVIKNIEEFEFLADFQVKKIEKNHKLLKSGDVYFCLVENKSFARQRCFEALKKHPKVVVSAFQRDELFGERSQDNFSFESKKNQEKNQNEKSVFVKDDRSEVFQEDETAFVCVSDVRKCFALSNKLLYHGACDKMKIVGITGTNGKTSTSFVIAEVLEKCGKKVGVIGTNGVYICGKKFYCQMTTPDADFLHKTFLNMWKVGVEYVVMEVSAHAIDQSRICGINFDVGVLTNITLDHLDYFHTFEKYAQTKLDFFKNFNVKFGVICFDDPTIYFHKNEFQMPYASYATAKKCDYFAKNIVFALEKTEFLLQKRIFDENNDGENDKINSKNIGLKTKEKIHPNDCFQQTKISTKLIGKFNVLNVLASIVVCEKLGLKLSEIKNALEKISPIEGRCNVLRCVEKTVVIDFAHTPDGLENLLKTIKAVCDGKIFLVFGCGGNRDKFKRKIMGEIANDYADEICLTNDNPRDEDPQKIVEQIEQGVTKDHFVELDRKKAIKKMIGFASEKDVVVIAGKGSENYQEIRGKKKKYSDFDVVKSLSK